MDARPLYEQLEEIVSQNPHLLVRFRSDLTRHDRRLLEDSRDGREFLWILRVNGTDVMPLHENAPSGLVEYWAGSEGQNVTDPHALYYHVMVTDIVNGQAHGVVRQIDPARAVDLARHGADEAQDQEEQEGMGLGL